MDYQLPLTQGKTAVIDWSDVPLISGHDWTASETAPGHWYATAKVDGRTNVYLHRLILGIQDGTRVYFIEHDGLNCRRSNLTLEHPGLRGVNHPIPRTRTNSPYRGVRPTPNGRWKSYFSRYYLGIFDDARDAARAYDDAARRHFGKRAIVNFRDNERLAA